MTAFFAVCGTNMKNHLLFLQLAERCGGSPADID